MVAATSVHARCRCGANLGDKWLAPRQRVGNM
eukprot:COSAG04_NODE_30966_length_259_cov_0.975000_1_plen_31_part_01